MKRTLIKQIYGEPEKFSGQSVKLCGWARNLRSGASVGFIELNDGSYFKNIQIVFEAENIDNYEKIAAQNTGAAFIIEGVLLLTPNSKQPFELNARKIELEGSSTPAYPLTKRHSPEFLRTIAHLRPRTNLYSAVFRVRSEAAFAVHKFFNEHNFVYIHTPIITTSDCEGGGNMFRVTAAGKNDKKEKNGNETEFFGREAFLTVSGQTNVECFALAYGNVYTFGPTFRAEASHTPKHAAEFWMIEPEMAFADLNDDIEVMRECLVYITGYILENCAAELEFLNKFVDNTLLERLNKLVTAEFSRVSYTEALKILEKSGEKFEFPVKWGNDIHTEYEKYLTDKYFGGPVFITDYPAEIKAFYMRKNDDSKTVAAVDLIVPGVGELIGGSQREERYELLCEALRQNNLNQEDYWWYLELRQYGSAKHSGFGIGFERLVMYLTGAANIRDVCAFPRVAGSADF